MTNKEIANKAYPIIFSKEGNYDSVNANDNGAMSIGKLQWHGTRALCLLKPIVRKLGETGSKKYITSALYKEITTASDWSKRSATDSEKKAIAKIISTDVGKAEQDEQAMDSLTMYIEEGKNLGLTDPSALIYFCDFANQYGLYSATLKQVVSFAIASDGGTLDAMYRKTKETVSKYLDRRATVYNEVKALMLPTEVKKPKKATYKKKEFINDLQAAFGLKQTGKVTASLLNKTVTISATTNKKHAAVKALQKYFLYNQGYLEYANEKKLDTSIDGIAGSCFTFCVTKYQKEVVGLANPDGIITAKNKTWKKLLGL